MNSKSTWGWIMLAALMFAAIVAVEKFGPKPPPGPQAIMPGFKAADVTSVQYTPAGQLEIRADRTNGSWRLTKPINYPAQAASIENLLLGLQQLAPANLIPGAEVRQRKNADVEFGFASRTSLTFLCGEESRQLLIGSLTAPGDGVYVQVVGKEGVYVLDSNLLKLLPAKIDDWRDTALVDLRSLTFDRITISNATAAMQLQRASTNELWRISSPIQTRADNVRLIQSLQKLQGTRVMSFVTDDPKADADSFGFQSPELDLTFAQGTNVLVRLQFGRSPTNDSTLVYARRAGSPSVVTVEHQPIEAWLVAVSQFRDPHLVTLLRDVDEIEIRGEESFVLKRTPTNGWQTASSDVPLDAGLVIDVLLALTRAPITQFYDSITEGDLPKYGLATPKRQVILRAQGGVNTTNTTIAEISFGDVKDGNVFVRRADENPVYAFGIADSARIPISPWQLRDRQIWRFSETNVVRLTIQNAGQKQDLRRLGPNSWRFAPGSQGILNGPAVEETAHRFGELDATAWIGRGEEERARFGFSTNNLIVTLELKDGTRHEVEFGGTSVDNYPYAMVKLAGQPWFFEFPIALHQLMTYALPIPKAGK